MAILRMVRADGADTTAESGKGIPLPIIAATAGRKADGVDLADLPWDFSRGVPTDGGHDYSMLWVHDLAGRNLPIGVVRVKVGRDGTSLDQSAAVFDPEDEFAVKTERKYRSKVGGLTGFSVTWEPVDADGMPSRATGKKAVANQLIEVSAVPVPLDPASLAKTERAGLASLARSIDAILGDEGGRTLPCAQCGTAVDDLPADAAMAWCSGECFAAWPEVRNWRSAGGALYVREMPETGPFGKDCEYSSLAECMKETGDMKACADLLKSTGEGCMKEERTAERPCCGDIDDEEPRSARADVPEEVAGAMLDVFDRGSDESDDERRRAYQRLLPKYRVLGWEPPEFVTAAELRALDDSTWRTLFLAGELQRVGAEISARNVADLREVADMAREVNKRLSALLDRVTADKGEEREAEGGTETRTAAWEATLAAYLKENH